MIICYHPPTDTFTIDGKAVSIEQVKTAITRNNEAEYGKGEIEDYNMGLQRCVLFGFDMDKVRAYYAAQ